ALLFCGAPGVGKLALAMGFAAYLLSEGTPSLPVTAPNARAMLRLWEHPDLHFTFPTIKKAGAASDYKPVSDDYAKSWHELVMRSPYFTIEQWLRQMGATTQQGIITAREGDELLRKLSLKSSLGGYKVSIIWLPERARAEFSNGILKLLEEPPQHTVFMLVSEEPNLLLDTIRSRTQRIDVKAIEEAKLAEALRDRRGLDDESARQTAHVSQGSWLQAMQFLSPDNENAEFFKMFQSLMRLCYMRKISELKVWTLQAAEMGREKEKRMLTYFIAQVRENFMYNFHIPELCYQSREEAAFSRNFARFINERNVIEISE
ncbi:DNA polymerase III, delta prime subunit, partial [gut metagenome]